ncbi:hypothetical protein Holit_00486 [Hollandina sp. SP2]
MDDEFKLVKSTRSMPVSGDSGSSSPLRKNQEIVDALATNFHRTLETADKEFSAFNNIVNLTKDIIAIEKIKVQSDIILKKMEEARRILLANAEAYVQKKNADTKNIVDRMRMIQDLLRDFYTFNQKNPSGLSGDNFTRIITELLSKTE